MKGEVLDHIYNLSSNSIRPITREGIVKLVSDTESKLGFSLSGYGLEDRPYRQYFSKEVLDKDFPRERISKIALEKAESIKDLVAYRCDRKVTFGELVENSIKFANVLKNDYGIKKGDIVVICTPSVPESIYAFFAINLIGGIVRPIDPTSNKEYIEKCIKESNSKCLITLDLFYSKLKSIDSVDQVVYLPIKGSIPNMSKFEKSIIGLSESASLLKIKSSKNKKWVSFYDAIKKYENSNLKMEDIIEPYEENESVAIFPTSGSTGESKGVVTTNENFLSSLYKQLYSEFDIDSTDSMFNPMPPSSSYFWYDIVLAIVWGVTTSLSPLFNPVNCAKEILNDESTVALVGPLLIQRICDYVKKENEKGRYVDFSKKKHLISGGDLLELSLEKEANEVLRKCGSSAIIENALGTSETCGPAQNPNGVLKNKDTYYEGCVGVVFPGNDVAIFAYDSENNTRCIDDENYNKGLMYYEVGEICYLASNPNVFKEYYNDRKNTDEALITHSDGTKWYHTGDLGYIDPAGHTFCMGRKSGLIVRDGHKVWAPKIENVAKEITGIKDCAVIGIPDEKEKETPACFIVYEDYVNEELKKQINSKLYTDIITKLDMMHAPTFYKELDEIPRNLMMKTKIKDLKCIYFEEIEKEKEKCKKKSIFKRHAVKSK